MMARHGHFGWAACGAAVLFLHGTAARAELSAEDLAKLAQNPVGNLVSVPFQNNTNFNYGPLSGTQNILNIQPVIPIDLNKDWNIITRTIMPVIWQPEFLPGQGSSFGLGDIQLSAFLSPASPGPGGLIWGAGAILQMPTNTDDTLGNKNWGLGPTAVVLHLDKGDPWVYGVLVNNVWSLSSDKQGGRYNNFLMQPFLNYNFPGEQPDRHRQLGSRQQPALDRAAGRRHRQDLPPGQAAGEHAARRVLQRGSSGRRCQLATSRPGAVHVPEVTAGGRQSASRNACSARASASGWSWCSMCPAGCSRSRCTCGTAASRCSNCSRV
jgi:hypothetical protein